MKTKSFVIRALYWMRDRRCRALFRALRQHCQGAVLDVGGWDFYRIAARRRVPFRTWTVLDVADVRAEDRSDPRVRFVMGDGCRLGFRDATFDTVLSIQVLEHAFEPLSMIQEMCRVLKEGGRLIVLVPQTASLHMAPHHYYNFTRYFLERAMRHNHMTVLELAPQGGAWSSVASRLFFLVFQTLRFPGMSAAECRRNALFYVLFPFMVLFVGVALPVCLLFALGDLTEEPNNHLLVACKVPGGGAPPAGARGGREAAG